MSISYEGLLEKVGKVKMSVCGLRILCVEMHKTIKKLNPKFNIFKVVRENYKLNLKTPEYSQVTFGRKSKKVHRLKNKKTFYN